jgi:hypothetical protein
MRSPASIAILGLTVLLSIGGSLRASQQDDDDFDTQESRILRGYRIAPVELRLRGLDPVLVGLGSYFVNAQGGCNDCHTAPPYAEGGDPFLGEPERINAEGYLAGGTPFGPFVSRNLTPRANGLPANLTWEQFLETMRQGTDFKNRHPQISPLLQVMPWPVFGKMTTRNLRAIYEYLKAIPSLPSPEPAS